MVLQQVLEDATGRPFAELMRELVLEPLGMSRSGYTQPLPDELHGQAATAHGSDGTPVEGGWHVYPELAAAGLWTTPGDLARFAIGVQSAAAGDPDALLGPALGAAMLTRHAGPAIEARRPRLRRARPVPRRPVVRAQRGQRGLPVPPDRTLRRGMRARGDDERRPGARARRGDP